MKIAPLIVIIAILGLGVAGWVYSSNQATTMKMVINAHGGSADTEATGLRSLNATLDGQAATAASERKEAMNASKGALTMLNRATDERKSAQDALDDSKTEREECLAKIEKAEANRSKTQQEADQLTALLRSLPALGADAELNMDTVEKLGTVVKEEAEKNKTLKSDLDEKEVVRKAATDKVAGETAELKRLTEINDKFFSDYSKNGDEFVIQAVDPRWKFVVFTAGKDSGLTVGDSTPLLVKRGDQPLAVLRVVSVTGGQVIAEYDADKLPAGVVLEVGDRVFRQKPLGS